MTVPAQTSQDDMGWLKRHLSNLRAEDYSKVIEGAGKGAEQAFRGQGAAAASQREVREKKRRTLADLLNKAYGREAALGRAHQQYEDETVDYQSQALQQVARGLIDSLQGATRRR